ncbi:hypothetical protein FB45DRAFT_378998 [Roridomyces roridus]|uniref:Uncharacterized protein n=1 Tax=Roridomyces roridus TaxID=1738132 RepID=A0AAD7B3A5_9AGAR|nr:hypothetical protein FB45DRAFT_378998 [Roridomyces roridus]
MQRQLRFKPALPYWSSTIEGIQDGRNATQFIDDVPPLKEEILQSDCGRLAQITSTSTSHPSTQCRFGPRRLEFKLTANAWALDTTLLDRREGGMRSIRDHPREPPNFCKEEWSQCSLFLSRWRAVPSMCCPFSTPDNRVRSVAILGRFYLVQGATGGSAFVRLEFCRIIVALACFNHLGQHTNHLVTCTPHGRALDPHRQQLAQKHDMVRSGVITDERELSNSPVYPLL